MDALSPTQAARLADAVLLLHAGIVAFAVLGQLLVVAGGLRGWRWIRSRAFRAAHLALVVFVALQAWLGRVCPLTTFEQQLRAQAGQPVHEAGLIEHWVGRLIFFEAPAWAFVVAYSAFAVVVVGSWWRWPPRGRAD
ncbi:DUF2784 domain-containing protein [Coralloluteibacterium stylophorae]|uniref:DUF2784 domain-containing protein n=1 Tax=Coralloluteibacterium stylophorae TaxID=1776034 RepID=A0A8J7VU83_9GAMM|nr:DUF2784 domain-containing protein [Coralloluteibacterium stylophorae]MBS7456705.1 DUF2784 domain-containing protein [Coralloluteibacterium stylophorae]